MREKRSSSSRGKNERKNSERSGFGKQDGKRPTSSKSGSTSSFNKKGSSDRLDKGFNDRPKKSFGKSDNFESKGRFNKGVDGKETKSFRNRDNDSNVRPFKKRFEDSGDRKPYRRREGDSDSRPTSKRYEDSGDRKPYRRREGDSDSRPTSKRYEDSGDRKPFRRREGDSDSRPTSKRYEDSGDRKPFRRREGDFDAKPSSRKPRTNFGDERPYKSRTTESNSGNDFETSKRGSSKKFFDYDEEKGFGSRRDRDYEDDFYGEDSANDKTPKRDFREKKQERKSFHKKQEKAKVDDGSIRLNKYLSNAGICSRREADTLIQTGVVTVNGQVITELGFKIMPGDKVVYGGEKIRTERKVYLLLNKPKDYITTTDDPQARRTVMDLVRGACKERVYPVGRLDRNTTGVLLLTNDGEITKKLLHPKHGIPKVYHVTLDKNVSKEDMESLYEGIELEDGLTRVDNIAYASASKSKKEVGVEIHSGKNRIVRRLFEHLGYTVVKLDRVSFAGLTKKDLSRGKYRFLEEKEIGYLKMIS
jgi:23S rRNA pseudouridine2605 synthase